ncbi:hypothetical protein Xmlh_03840, partial [Xanthomonas axonopodis pv. melhusii]
MWAVRQRLEYKRQFYGRCRSDLHRLFIARQSYDNGVLKRQQLFYDDQGRVVRIVQTLPDGVTRLLET